MEFIKVKKNEMLVRMKITIEYIGPYVYDYVISPENNFSYNSADKPSRQSSQDYNIGEGIKLTEIGNYWNYWDFRLINTSNKDLEYTLYIEWYQEGDENNPIYTWPKDPKLRKGIIKSYDSQKILSDNCSYRPQ